MTTIPQEYDGAIASSGFCVIRPFLINPRYVFYYILNQAFIDSVNKLAKGTSYPAVTNKIILEQNIPLPPLQEQYRIVSKIEELFSELDNAITNLRKADSQLEVYKQASLKSAFEGEFTNSWRKENKPLHQISKWVRKKKEEEYASKLETWEKSLKHILRE
ncbi:MAG: restriction endonuclease subunit S [Chitinophagaceae bacterium]|nr:restriction endonuclease subunit S [Chitinophagaceae bacterium]